MKKIYPSDLLHQWETQPKHLRPHKIAYDTETSGLHPDAGARISTVSVAWIVPNRALKHWQNLLEWTPQNTQHIWDDGIWTLRKEACEGAKTGKLTKHRWVISLAWAFDQGTTGTGKPEDPTEQILNHGTQGLPGLLDWTPDKPTADSGNCDIEEWTALLRWLGECGADSGLTAHNAKFDIRMAAVGCRRWEGHGINLTDITTWDTMLGADLWIKWQMAKATGTRPSNQLKTVARWLWSETEGDEQETIKRYLQKHKLPKGRWDLIPWKVIARYADQDARLTARLRKWEETEAKRVKKATKTENTTEKGWKAGAGTQGMERRMAVMRMLTRVEQRGLPFNTEKARKAGKQLQKRIDQTEQTLNRELGGKPTLDMAKHYWFGHGDKWGNLDDDGRPRTVKGLGLRNYGTTGKGSPIVDVATLAKMQRDRLPLVNDWIAHKRLVDAKSRWYDGWADRAGDDRRLRTSFRQVGTESGRFSVEGIQLQAIPADYKVEGTLAGIPSPRDLIGAGIPDGYELWEMDLAQAELRVAAWMAGCQKMLDAIDRGADLHGETARELFEVTKDSAEWGEKRQVAKRANFSLIFGVGWYTFQETLWREAGIEMSDEEAKQVVQAWNRLYPEYRQAIKIHEERVLRRYKQFGIGWMADGNVGSAGERRWFPKWDVHQWNSKRQEWQDSAHKAFNQRVQPALAQYGQDLWLGAEIKLREKYGDGTAGLCLMVHDSMVLLLPEGDGEQVCAELRMWGQELWAERFPGLPGDLDASRWDEHA